MPTQKDLKATRKLKRKATKVNNRRRNVGKQPLSFKHFYKSSHKNFRHQLESRNKNNESTNITAPPNKKRKFNKPQRGAPFGFGKNIDDPQSELEYQRLLADIAGSQSDSASDPQSDNDDNSLQMETEPPTPSDLRKENEEIKKNIKEHQSALDSLKHADPEFYKHLQEMDGNLLSFGDNNQFDLGELGDIDDAVTSIQKHNINKIAQDVQIDDISNIDDDINAFMEEQANEKSDDDADDEEDCDVADTYFEFDLAELQELIKDLEEKKSVAALQRILNGFCSFVEVTVEAEKAEKEKTKLSKTSKTSFAVANNAAFQKLLHYILTKLAAQIKNTFNISAKQQLQNVTPNKRFMRHRPLFNRYFKLLHLFFATVYDPSMQRLYLIHCRELIFVIITLHESIRRKYIVSICKLWASSSANVRIDAFIFLYECGKRVNDSQLMNIYKYMYAAFVKICKRVSRATMPGISFLMNCLVEMYSLNPVVAYKDAFKRLRSIAFHVKQSLLILSRNEKNKKNRKKSLKQYKLETIASIYNWRFVNIIRLWAKVLGSHCGKKNSDLHLLFYPFIQICCSVLTITRSAAYNPARLKIIQTLIELIKSSKIYIPLAPYLIAIINNPAFKKKIVKENKKEGFELSHKIKIADNDFNTNYLHNALFSDGLRLMVLYFENYSCFISFPEICFPTQVFLKEFAANDNICGNMKLMKAKIKIFSSKLSENSNWIRNKRKNVQFSPKDFEKVDAFLAYERVNDMSPLAKFVKSKQFEMLLLLNGNGEKGDNYDGEDEDENDKQIKKRKDKKVKKRKKRMGKILREENEKKNKKNKKIVTDLKQIYDKNKNSKNVAITGLGDVVKDFQWSDDDD